MKYFTPDLCLLLNDVTFDVASHEPLVTYGFSSPSLEVRNPPSFGCFMSTTSLCISLLTKSERSPSRSHLSDEEVEIIRPRLLYILEVTLYLILTQVMLYLRSGALGLKETNMLKREIGTEINACILGMQRYYRKLTPASPGNRGMTTPSTGGSTPSFSSSASRSPRRRSMHSPAIASVLAENGLYKLADQFVKDILK
ncbi:nucleoporin NUP188-like [Watersipora subatra]|uniref:nucleoporin NUP188-like n=1 Tax=Watersipora subatra TaxID=2589382 RepID=UPI00355C30EC